MNERDQELSAIPRNEAIPPHLAERIRVHHEGDGNGEYVLYWIRSALRVDENPALDVARILAAELDLPLLVYQGLSETYTFASDRHHTFMLQAAQELAEQFRSLDIEYAFHLETHLDRRKHLLELSNRAAIVITEEMPVDPPRRFLNALAAQTRCTVACVDTACVVPMRLVRRAYDRAFAYRNATKKLYAERLTRGWPETDAVCRPFDSNLLPFKPIDFDKASIADLVASCAIDHSIGHVVDTPGGSKAGYARWEEFRQRKLARYAKQRNNALLDGVSRMSPYLHYGMVSPLRIAREAAEVDHPGAEKFLDELLIWRELAYAFCFHRTDHDQWSALPDWAQETLLAHADDVRKERYTWEQLARGQTSSTLWNAAQLSLVMHGELHNNVRMTWGKAILDWTPNPQDALQSIIDLNHRYALDGRDPSSYGGILWCLGQFDRPFKPAQPILGTVRPRPLEQHAERLSPDAYHAKVSSPRCSPVPSVAVIGAGISGLFAARTLMDHGLPVTVFEKSRGAGGRMSTRRTKTGQTFDHGAQYFTVRNPIFARYVDSWADEGLVAPWPDSTRGDDQRIVVLKEGEVASESNSQRRYVGVPAMNSICKHLASHLRLEKQVRVHSVKPAGNQLELFDDQGVSLGQFDRLVISAPAEQSAEILSKFPKLSERAAGVKMSPCWATMVALPESVNSQWVGAFIHDSFLSWAAKNDTKPGRSQQGDQFVIHASPEWTAEHWEHDPDQVASLMLEEFFRVTDWHPLTPDLLQAHRWKYAIPLEPVDDGCLFDEQAGIAVCGDWLSNARVEGAFLSGMSAAGRILGTLSYEAATDRQGSNIEPTYQS